MAGERRELEATVVGITDLAKEYDIPVILLAQLNRVSDYSDPFPLSQSVQVEGDGDSRTGGMVRLVHLAQTGRDAPAPETLPSTWWRRTGVAPCPLRIWSLCRRMSGSNEKVKSMIPGVG